jgi:hypothetical protein
MNTGIDADWKDVKNAFEKLLFDLIKVIQWETFVNTVINPQQLVQRPNNCQSVVSEAGGVAVSGSEM